MVTTLPDWIFRLPLWQPRQPENVIQRCANYCHLHISLLWTTPNHVSGCL
ncbi:MAG: hypothetical protein ACFNLD_08065 [Kingella oralis]|nr:hypothetical protein [Kingella oralis]